MKNEKINTTSVNKDTRLTLYSKEGYHQNKFLKLGVYASAKYIASRSGMREKV
ncbi:MAG: hypothetical protein NZ529_10965 [Cytophagaceae bacterium]|nr:hypothetical protein [Cytophagaceae bacterium]MDW8457306.1 hypothetical protein [Cytophagaceae bacterium]